MDKKIYWCQCIKENPEFSKHIKLGSVPKDTGEICAKCGGIIFEEEKKDYKEIYKKYID